MRSRMAPQRGLVETGPLQARRALPGTPDAGLYPPDPDLSVSDPNYFELRSTHELARGAFAPQLDAFMKATRWWRAKDVGSHKRDRRPTTTRTRTPSRTSRSRWRISSWNPSA